MAAAVSSKAAFCDRVSAGGVVNTSIIRIALCSVKPRALRYAKSQELCANIVDAMQTPTATTSALQDVVDDKDAALVDISNTAFSKKVE